jgi:amino acid transporter
VMGVRGYSTPLDQIDAPLNVLATLAHVPILQVPLSLGAMVSFFALCLSCINAGGRVIFAMGRHGIFHPATADSHEKNETPHVAVTLMALLAFFVPSALVIGGVAPLDAFNYVGTCAAFGFIVAYCLVTVAAPAYLKRLGELKGRDIAGCAAALVLLAIPAVGSVYPIPDPPVKYFPYLFLVYLAVGIVWILAFYRRKPAALAVVQADLERSHAGYQGTQPITITSA